MLRPEGGGRAADFRVLPLAVFTLRKNKFIHLFMEIKTLFFDFGGCIDAPGIHTRTLFWSAFERAGLVTTQGRDTFQDSFSQADRRMMASGEAKALGLRAFNRLNGKLIAGGLGINSAAGEAASSWVTEEMEGNLKSAKYLLEELSELVELGIISNFTGNLEVILREFSLRSLFGSVTESFYEGCAKPDSRIFLSALGKQAHSPGNCLFIGDNPVNDIAPAKALGMRTALIHCAGEKKECGADFYLEDLRDLLSIIKNLA